MNGAEVREKFLAYFESKGHTRVSSSALIPENDPTLLFTNAGMNQFKECFLGTEKRAYTRAVTSQKCLRISGKHNDFENVGMTARHHTFFEMLGNFSFGDYFKADAIKYGWEFVTEVLALPKSRLWVTIYEEDDEAGELWAKLTDIDPKRIVKMGKAENFWAMGDTGPCGPCSEIHYYLGKDESKQSEKVLRGDDGTFMEIWNLVFMQYNRYADGKLEPLPKPSVDTGMGLERVSAIKQGVPSNYDTDLLRPIISECERLSGFRYDGSSYEKRDLRKDKDYARDVAMRVIADHSRAAAFLIAEGVHPGSDGRAYVLRRIIRRAIRHGKVLEFAEPFLAKTTACVVEMLGKQYPELVARKEMIAKVTHAEETHFHETLDAGLAILQREVSKTKKGKKFPGDVAFQLHDTFGFPLDLTQDALKAYEMEVDVPAFEECMAAQKERSRSDRKAQGITFASRKISGPKTKFVGYDELEADAKVTDILLENDGDKAGKGDRVSVVVDTTPFYAESGGQVGDTGIISIAKNKLRVIDTQKAGDGFFVHNTEVIEGEITPKLKGKKATLEVDAARRQEIRLNHSATHLVHAALRKILGTHVKQAGSRVDDRTLRFDYSHFEAVSDAALSEIQSFVNEQIRSNHEVSTRKMALDKARKMGAMALFGEKYGDTVRVVQIGPDSIELCGGTHVERSGDIGFLLVGSESSISAGVRRIECVTGSNAHAAVLRERGELMAIAELLKSDTGELPSKIEKVLQRTKQLERELEEAKSKIASSQSGDLLGRARTSPSGVKVIAEKVDGADSQTLKSMVDTLRVQLGSGVVALGSGQGAKAVIVAGVTSDLTKSLHAGTLVQEASKMSGGKGGGRPDFAQAGGVEPSQLNAALNRFFELIA